MAEIDYTQDLLVRLSMRYHPLGVFYRRNVGVATPIGRTNVIRFGLKGQADLGGILNSFAIEIETKIGKNGLSQAQKNWQAAVERSKGIYIIAYPETEAETFARLDGCI